MNLEQMEYIKEIIHTQSISIAAKNLHVSQSAVSQSISLLEKELGIQLFNRSRFGTIPTEEGKSIINKALKIVENIEKIKEESLSTATINGELRIAALPSFLPFLPKTLSLFKKDYPHIKISIIEMESKRIIEKIIQHKVDLGFTSIEKGLEESLPEHVLLSNLDYNNPDIKVIVPKYSPLSFQKLLTVQDLSDYPIVIYSSQYWENFITTFEESYGSVNVLFRTSNSEVIKRTVSEGIAIGLVSSYHLIDDPYVETGRIIPLPLNDFKFVSNLSFVMIASKKNTHHAIVKKFSEYIQL